jgi:hypothetical protein
MLHASRKDDSSADRVEVDADTDTDTDTDSDADTDTDVDADSAGSCDSNHDDTFKVDTAPPNVFIDGTAEVVIDASYEGKENLRYETHRYGDNLCTLTYTVTSSEVRTDCDECTFAFALVGSGTTAEGPRCSDWCIDPTAYDGRAWAVGYAPTYAYTYGTSVYTFYDVLMYDWPGYGWYAIAANGYRGSSVSFSGGSSGTFEYEYPRTYSY